MKKFLMLRLLDSKMARLKVLTLTILLLTILQLITGCGGSDKPDEPANETPAKPNTTT